MDVGCATRIGMWRKVPEVEFAEVILCLISPSQNPSLDSNSLTVVTAGMSIDCPGVADMAVMKHDAGSDGSHDELYFLAPSK